MGGWADGRTDGWTGRRRTTDGGRTTDDGRRTPQHLISSPWPRPDELKTMVTITSCKPSGTLLHIALNVN